MRGPSVPPAGVDGCRVIAVVTGPGSARFDDVSLVPTTITPRYQAAQMQSGPYRVRLSENGVLSVEMQEEYQLWDGGIVVVMEAHKFWRNRGERPGPEYRIYIECGRYRPERRSYYRQDRPQSTPP